MIVECWQNISPVITFNIIQVVGVEHIIYIICSQWHIVVMQGHTKDLAMWYQVCPLLFIVITVLPRNTTFDPNTSCVRALFCSNEAMKVGVNGV